MSNKKENPDQILDQAIAGIREEAMDDRTVEQAAAHVWAKLAQKIPAGTASPAAGDPLRTCEDFRALIPAYIAKKLQEAQAWLLEDHIHTCAACRHELERARFGKVTEMKPAAPRRSLAPQWKWAIAASLAIGSGLGAWAMRDAWLPAPGGPRGVVASVDGLLYRVSASGSTAVRAGAEISEREGILTAQSSRAMLRLADGSLVEVKERSELSLSRKYSGTTIHLERGSVIVQAAKQHSGHLYVATGDCLVSVKGTIFAVDHGTKGSRVAVIQGVVHVDGAQASRTLHPGDQMATGGAMTPVAIKDEISWSQNQAQYLALLGEFAIIGKQLEQMPGPGLRYSSQLLEFVPAGTVLYAAIPNVGGMLGDAQQIFNDRLSQSEVLRNWWNSVQGSVNVNQVIDTVRTFSSYLGNEVVLTAAEDSRGELHAPLVMAQVTQGGFREYLEQQIGQISAKAKGLQLTIVDNAAALPAGGGAKDAAWILLMNNVVAVSPDPANLQAVAALIQQPGSGTFSTTAFYQRIAEGYRAGAGWLITTDMEQILANSVRQQERRNATRRNAEMQAAGTERALFNQLGVFDAQHLVFERKEVGGKTANHVVLTFSQPRRGIASWLGAPAPMGALDFISPDASLAAAFVAKQPRAALQEVFAAIQSADPNFGRGQAEFESRAGVSVLDDLAGPLGSEVALAVDGPLVPIPSWKLAIAVYDPARLEQTIETLLKANVDGHAVPWQLSQAQVGGRTYYSIASANSPLEIHYTFVDGYLVAAANQALLTQTLSQRAAGYSLTRSANFKALLAPDGYSNFSAILYQNLQPVLKPVADQLRATGLLGAEQQKSIDALSANSEPTLIYAYGEPDRIELASTGSFFGLKLDSVLGGSSVLRMLGGTARAIPTQ